MALEADPTTTRLPTSPDARAAAEDASFSPRWKREPRRVRGSGFAGLRRGSSSSAFQGVVPAADQANYTIEFKSDGSFSAKADCNTTSGTYTTTSSGGLTITPGPTTLVACPEGSLSPQYIAALGNAASYVVANGQLTITLKDGGTLVYK